MWRASADTLYEYQLHNLWELIPGDDQHHIIFYRDDSLLFLLSLVDTIDPIKAFCRDKRYQDPASAISVLNNVYVHFVNRTGVKRLDLSYYSSEFKIFVDRNADPEHGMMSWLGVFTDRSTNSQGIDTLSISVDLVAHSTI